MPVQTLRMRDLHPAQDEFSPFGQSVHIVTDANMNHAGDYKVKPCGHQAILARVA